MMLRIRMGLLVRHPTNPYCCETRQVSARLIEETGIFWGTYHKMDVFPVEQCGNNAPLVTIHRNKSEAGHCVKYSDIGCNVQGLPNDPQCMWQSVKLS